MSWGNKNKIFASFSFWIYIPEEFKTAISLHSPLKFNVVRNSKPQFRFILLLNSMSWWTQNINFALFSFWIQRPEKFKPAISLHIVLNSWGTQNNNFASFSSWIQRPEELKTAISLHSPFKFNVVRNSKPQFRLILRLNSSSWRIQNNNFPSFSP